MPRIDLEFERGLLLTQAADYSFTDDATPLGLDDTSGSVGAYTVSFDRQGMRPADIKGLRKQGVFLQVVGEEERLLGEVSGVTGTEAGATVDIDSVALRLAVKRDVPPFRGTLYNGLVAWLSACGISAGRLDVETAIAPRTVALVGFSDNVWTRLKQMTAALGIEIVVQDANVVVRLPRAVVVSTDRLAAKSWEVDSDTTASSIEVAYYDPTPIVGGSVLPDYSRSNVTDGSDPDDPGGGIYDATNPSNALPPGWTKVGTVGTT